MFLGLRHDRRLDAEGAAVERTATDAVASIVCVFMESLLLGLLVAGWDWSWMPHRPASERGDKGTERKQV